MTTIINMDKAKDEQNQRYLTKLSHCNDEIGRFLKRFEACRNEFQNSPYSIYSSRRRAALRRAALDLMIELRRL